MCVMSGDDAVMVKHPPLATIGKHSLFSLLMATGVIILLLT
jgi:hypothetical protein